MPDDLSKPFDKALSSQSQTDKATKSLTRSSSTEEEYFRLVIKILKIQSFCRLSSLWKCCTWSSKRARSLRSTRARCISRCDRATCLFITGTSGSTLGWDSWKKNRNIFTLQLTRSLRSSQQAVMVVVAVVQDWCLGLWAFSDHLIVKMLSSQDSWPQEKKS